MKTLFSPEDRWPFPKHKDKLVKNVIRDDPEYVLWCLEKLDNFELDANAEDALEWAMADIWDED